MRLEFHPEAELELIAAAVHYEEQVLGLGQRFEAEIHHATHLLLAQPNIGVPVDSNLRKFILIRFPFALYYSVTLMCCALRRLHSNAAVQAIGSQESSLSVSDGC